MMSGDCLPLDEKVLTSRCTVIRTFWAIFPTPQKSYATIFLGCTGPHFAREGIVNLFYSSIGPVGHNILWKNRQNRSF